MDNDIKILCVTSVRNEAPFLLEWIAHLQAAGVTDFLIYSNDCDDGTDKMLNILSENKVITHIQQTSDLEKSIQWTALKSAWKHPLRKVADWVLVCDVDEFVNIKIGNHKFSDLISAVPSEADAITLPWRLFGHNNIIEINDIPVTEQFFTSIPIGSEYPIATTFFKTLFRTKGPFNQFGIHRPRQKKKGNLPIWVNASGLKLPEFFCSNDKRLSLIGLENERKLVELNHYSVKSVQSFIVKTIRGLPNRSNKNIDLAYWVERNFNTEKNESIFLMRKFTQKYQDILLKLPNLLNIHQQSIIWHRNKFMKIIINEEMHNLYSQLLLSGSSIAVSQKTGQNLINLYQKVLESKRIIKLKN